MIRHLITKLSFPSPLITDLQPAAPCPTQCCLVMCNSWGSFIVSPPPPLYCTPIQLKSINKINRGRGAEVYILRLFEREKSLRLF